GQVPIVVFGNVRSSTRARSDQTPDGIFGPERTRLHHLPQVDLVSDSNHLDVAVLVDSESVSQFDRNRHLAFGGHVGQLHDRNYYSWSFFPTSGKIARTTFLSKVAPGA